MQPRLGTTNTVPLVWRVVAPVEWEEWTSLISSPNSSEVVDSSVVVADPVDDVSLRPISCHTEGENRGADGFVFRARSERQQGPRRGKDLVHRIGVSLEDLYKGKVQKLALSKSTICKTCDGLGGKKGAVKECSGCKGAGVKVHLRQLGPMVQQIQQPCGDCEGTGEIVDPKNKCRTCNAKKTTQERKILEVHIDKGMKSGHQIKFPGESDQAPGVEPGDVIFVVEEKEHPRFKRNGDDLVCEAEVDLLTALGGGEFHIEHLDDKILRVIINPGEIIKPGESSDQVKTRPEVQN